MGWPKLLVVVRHAESEGNVRTADERAQMSKANFRFSLTERGRRQAVFSGEYIKKVFGGFDVYFRSYYERVRETFDVMFPSVKAIEDARLAEGQRGIWHTMTAEKIAAIFPEEVVRREREGFYHYRPIGGENWPDIELRIHSFVEMLRQDYNGKHVLVVAHGQWLILLQKIIERTTMEDALAAYNADAYDNASITVYKSEDKNGEFRLHLKSLNILPWQSLL